MKTKKKQKKLPKIQKIIARNSKLFVFVLAAIFVMAVIFQFPAVKQRTQRFINTAFAADLSAIVASSGSDINLTAGSYAFSGDLTIPAGKTLRYERGAVIHINAGQTLNIAGGMDDHLYQIFDDQSGDLSKGVKFSAGNIVDVRPEWWGARADLVDYGDFVDGVPKWDLMGVNTNAINQAINSHVDYKTNVIFSAGTYLVKDTITMKGSTSLIGNGESTIEGAPRVSNGTALLTDSAPLSPDQQSEISGINFNPDCAASSPLCHDQALVQRQVVHSSFRHYDGLQ